MLAVAVAAALVGSSPRPVPASPPAPAPVAAEDALARRLVEQVSAAGAQPHLAALQEVAEASGGQRAAGSDGYDASVRVVVEQLRVAGFDVETPAFGYPVEVVLASAIRVGDQELRADRLTGSPDTRDGGVAGPLVVVPEDGTSGCQAEDLEPLPVRESVLLVRRGGCPFAAKARRAADAGAAALVVVNNEPGPLTGGTLRGRAALPVGGVSTEDGDRLAARAGTVVALDLRSRTETRTSRNVVAQTRTGRTDDVVVVGGHLDSVEQGPGINDNGSGAAGLLELATRLGPAPPVHRAVRFAWWGAEEIGLLGSKAYVEGLEDEARRSLGLYLNIDMIGSPNPGYFVYDGDDSARDGAGPGPRGSAELERTLADFLAARGVPPEPTDLDGSSDYAPFLDLGVPVGGLFSGANAVKTPEQAARWGGRAGQPFDPCYHRACDDLSNIDLPALDRHLDALAWTVGRYASVTGATPIPAPTPVRSVVPALAPHVHRRVVSGRQSPTGGTVRLFCRWRRPRSNPSTRLASSGWCRRCTCRSLRRRLTGAWPW